MGSRAWGGEGLASDEKKDTSFSGKGVTSDHVDAEAGHSPFGGGKISEDPYDVFAFPCWVRQTLISCAGQVGGEGRVHEESSVARGASS